jgi:hypothetical protein
LRALTQAATKRGKSKGRLAKDIVTAALMNFSRFDELDHRLSVIERALEHVIGRLDLVDAQHEATGQLRAAMAMSITRLLIEAGGAEMSDAVNWTKEVFGVEEEP